MMKNKHHLTAVGRTIAPESRGALLLQVESNIIDAVADLLAREVQPIQGHCIVMNAEVLASLCGPRVAFLAARKAGFTRKDDLWVIPPRFDDSEQYILYVDELAAEIRTAIDELDPLRFLAPLGTMV